MKPKIVWPWQENHGLFSLADMLRYPIRSMVAALDEIYRYDALVKGFAGHGKIPFALAPLRSAAKSLGGLAETLGMIATSARCKQLGKLISTARENRDRTCSELSTELSGLIDSITNELSSITFVHVEHSRLQYFDNADLFGPAVSVAFPSAKRDIVDAGNSLAVGLHTAGVFHLMAVINVGMVALCRHLKVKIKSPEHHDWARILNELESRIEDAHKMPRGKKRQLELEFYADLVGELRALKDAHRNSVSHSLRRYNDPEARGVCERVGGFMRRLATRVRE